jgi:hypothetical protein
MEAAAVRLVLRTCFLKNAALHPQRSFLGQIMSNRTLDIFILIAELLFWKHLGASTFFNPLFYHIFKRDIYTSQILFMFERRVVCDKLLLRSKANGK